MVDSIAIVGASLAGARAAQTLRQSGFEGRVLLIGDEQAGPYERPPLSKEALLADTEPQWVCPPESYSDTGIELMTGCKVTALQRVEAAFCLELIDGSKISVGKVLLTTGGRPRRLAAGEGVRGVHYLRTWNDALDLKGGLLPGARVVVIGSGFIGAEVAATAVRAGCQVDVLEVAPRIFGAIHSPVILDKLRDAHQAAGVKFRTGVRIRSISNAATNEVVLALEDGEELRADSVVVGIGMIPNVELAVSVGAKLGAGGVVVDSTYESSVPGLHAAGDVATLDVNGTMHRTEHWRNAQEQGVGAALGMLGKPVPDLPAPWSWSDQHGHRLEIAGAPSPVLQRVERAISESEHVTFHLDDRRLVGVSALNASRVVRDSLSRLIRRWHPDINQLTDPARPLSKVQEANT